NFQVINLLAVALKPEMSRFDDAGMHRSDRNFMNFLTGHCEEICDAWLNGNFRRAVPGIVADAVGTMKTNRLQPRMAFGTNAPLLGDFAFEPMRLRTNGYQRGILAGDL